MQRMLKILSIISMYLKISLKHFCNIFGSVQKGKKENVKTSFNFAEKNKVWFDNFKASATS